MTSPALGRPLPYLESDTPSSVSESEREHIQRVVSAIEQFLKMRDQKGPADSDVHVKTHGFATGVFSIPAGLPDELAQGLFGAPGEYEAIVRFSNSADVDNKDSGADGRGLAIKLFGVRGERVQAHGLGLAPEEPGATTQDFVMINHPVFFSRDAADYVRIEESLHPGGGGILGGLNKAFAILAGGKRNPFDLEFREVGIVKALASHPPINPAAESYFSMSAFRYGDYVAKYRTTPSAAFLESLPNELRSLGAEPNAMGILLATTLSSRAVEFDFGIQLRRSAAMPVDDPTTEWSEQESPYITVAKLTLGIQDSRRPEMSNARNKLAFNIWHSLEAHRPLGSLNRLRLGAYHASARWRCGGNLPMEAASRDDLLKR